ncbi:MAG: hypothetical protein AAGB04_03225 [Pseudomonadota bacterium]
MSDHPEVPIEKQVAAVDGRLSAIDRAAVDKQLDQDPSLAAALDADRAIADRLRAELSSATEEPIPIQLLRAARAHTRQQTSLRTTAIAASIVAALVLGGIGGWLGRGVAPQNASITELRTRTTLAMQLFGEDVDKAVDIASSDPRTVRDWYRARIGLAVSPPDLSAFGFTLAGCRTMMGTRLPAALIAYRGGEGRHLVLFLRHDMDGASGHDLVFSTEGRHTIAVWSNGRHGFGVAGAPAEDDMRRIVMRIRDKLSGQV